MLKFMLYYRTKLISIFSRFLLDSENSYLFIIIIIIIVLLIKSLGESL